MANISDPKSNCVSYGELHTECPRSHESTRTDLERFPVPGAPLSTYRHQILEWKRGKCDDARSISDENMMRFYSGLGPLESNNSTFSLALLICCFSLLILIPLMEFELLLL
jgi:hypothetical protein